MNNNCPDCNSKKCVEKTDRYTFTYGIENNKVILSSNFIWCQCQACGLVWSDSRTEEEKTSVINEYLINI